MVVIGKEHRLEAHFVHTEGPRHLVGHVEAAVRQIGGRSVSPGNIAALLEHDVRVVAELEVVPDHVEGGLTAFPRQRPPPRRDRHPKDTADIVDDAQLLRRFLLRRVRGWRLESREVLREARSALESPELRTPAQGRAPT